MPVQVKRTRSESRRRSQRSAGVRRNSTSNARNKKLLRKGALRMHDGTEWGSFDAYLRKNYQSKVELILFKKQKLNDRGREDRVVKLRLLLQQVVAMEKHLTPDDSGVHPIILFTTEAQHSLGTMSEAEREAWGKDLTQFTARDYYFAVTVPPQEAFLPQPPVGVTKLHLNPHREVLLLTTNSSQAKLPTMVRLWSFDTIQSFGASDNLLVIQTSSQTDAKDYCCFVTSAAEEIAEHLSQLVTPEENIYDTIDIESGSGDSSSSRNGSGDEAECENHDLAVKDRGSPYRRSYLRAVGAKKKVLLDEDSELLKSEFHKLPHTPHRNTYAAKWKQKSSPSIRVIPNEDHSTSPPTTPKGVISIAKNSPLLRRLLGSGERSTLSPETDLIPPPASSPIGQPPDSPSLDDISRPRSPFLKLKRWLSPSRLSPKVAAAELPSDSLEQGLVDSWEEGVLDKGTTDVSPLPSPLFRRRRRRQPAELDVQSDPGRNTPTPPPLGSPLHWAVSTERTSPTPPTAAQSTLSDGDSKQGEVETVAGCSSVVSNKEGHTSEVALPDTAPSLLAEPGEDSGGLHSSGAASQTDRTQLMSLQDKNKQPILQDESEQLNHQDERQSLQGTVLRDTQQEEPDRQLLQSLQGEPTNGVDGVDERDGTDETFPAESSRHTSDAISASSTRHSPPTHKPLGRIQSDTTSVHPKLSLSHRRFSATDGEELALRARSCSFSEMIQNIFVSSLDRPSSQQSERCTSPLSIHSHSISDGSAQLDTDVWPEMVTDLDALTVSRDRKENPLLAAQSPSLSSSSQMASFSLGSTQSSSDADRHSEALARNTYEFHGSLVRMRKVHRRTDSEVMPSPPAAPRWLRGRSKSASHTLPRHARSFSARPLPRAPVGSSPAVLPGPSSEYLNTADLADSRYVNMTKDLLDESKIYDKIDVCSELEGHYATLDFAALQFLRESGRSVTKPASASNEEECVYAKVDIVAMEAARQLADQRRREREVRSQSQTSSVEREHQRRHTSNFNTLQARSSGTHRRLRAWSSVGLGDKEEKTFTE